MDDCFSKITRRVISIDSFDIFALRNSIFASVNMSNVSSLSRHRSYFGKHRFLTDMRQKEYELFCSSHVQTNLQLLPNNTQIPSLCLLQDL